MTVKITRKMLAEKDACEDQLNLFTEHFPNGVEFENEEDAIEKCFEFAEIFDFERVADELLNADTWTKYLAAIEVAKSNHNKALKLLWAQLERSTKSGLHKTNNAASLV